jgi:hypothetical protein
MDLIAAFRLFVRTVLIHCALLGQKQKYIKSQTTAKLKEKRTSIVAVRDILRMFETFPNPLLSRCRLPFKQKPNIKICPPLKLMQCKHYVMPVSSVRFSSQQTRQLLFCTCIPQFCRKPVFFLEKECHASANGRTVAAIRNYNTWFFKLKRECNFRVF